MMIIDPFKSVGSMLFSDTREQIRQKMNKNYTAGVKAFGEIKDYYDCFDRSTLFVYYDERDNINAFEFFEGDIIFNEVNLLQVTYHSLAIIFAHLDPDVSEEYGSFTSFRYGIGGSTNQDPEDELAMPQSVIIFKKGYYDKVKELIN